MQAHQLKPAPGSKHARKRIGRGNAAGQGTYSGRGLKGQKSRAGNKPRRYFEGGQTRMMKRLPRRRGFTNLFRVGYQAVNLTDLTRFEAGSEVTPEMLKETRVLRSLRTPIKVLGTGEMDRPLTVRANRFSQSAREKIEAAGGTVIETDPRPEPRPKREKAGKKKSQKPGAQKPKREAIERSAAEPEAGASEAAEAEASEDADGDEKEEEAE
jgi:large subunit ribosomal protein L15